MKRTTTLVLTALASTSLTGFSAHALSISEKMSASQEDLARVQLIDSHIPSDLDLLGGSDLLKELVHSASQVQLNTNLIDGIRENTKGDPIAHIMLLSRLNKATKAETVAEDRLFKTYDQIKFRIETNSNLHDFQAAAMMDAVITLENAYLWNDWARYQNDFGSSENNRAIHELIETAIDGKPISLSCQLHYRTETDESQSLVHKIMCRDVICTGDAAGTSVSYTVHQGCSGPGLRISTN